MEPLDAPLDGPPAATTPRTHHQTADILVRPAPAVKVTRMQPAGALAGPSPGAPTAGQLHARRVVEEVSRSASGKALHGRLYLNKAPLASAKQSPLRPTKPKPAAAAADQPRRKRGRKLGIQAASKVRGSKAYSRQSPVPPASAARAGAPTNALGLAAESPAPAAGPAEADDADDARAEPAQLLPPLPAAVVAKAVSQEPEPLPVLSPAPPATLPPLPSATAAHRDRFLAQDPFAYIQHIQAQPDHGRDDDFVYMNVVELDHHFTNPYQLEIVPHSAVNPDNFYTASKAGITHYLGGVAEFTPLEQWEREHKYFHDIMQIPFFAKFRMWKAFSAWKRHVRRRKFSNACKVLEHDLFILNPHIRPSLLAICQIALRMASVRLHKIDPLQVYTLAELSDLHATGTTEMRAWFEKVADMVLQHLVTACRTHLEDAGFLEDLPAGPVARPASLSAIAQAASADPAVFDGPGPADVPPASPSPADPPLQAPSPAPPSEAPSTRRNPRRRPIRALGPDQEELLANAAEIIDEKTGLPLLAEMYGGTARRTYTEMAAKRAVCRRLANFVRMIDYLVIETLHTLALDSVHDMAEYVAHAKHPRVAVDAANAVISTSAAEEAEDTEDADEDAAEGGAEGDAVKDNESDGGDAAAAADAKSSNDEREPTEGPRSHSSSPIAIAPGTPAAAEDKLPPPLISIELTLATETTECPLDFQPKEGDFHELVDTMAADFVSTVLSLPRFLPRPELDPYLQSSVGDRSNSVVERAISASLYEIIWKDEMYPQITTDIKACLTAAYRDSETYAALFETFRSMFLDNRDTRVDEVRAAAEAGMHTLEAFRDDLVRYKKQQALIGDMSESADVGVVRVDSRALKELLTPSPARCLNDLHELLPELATTRNKKLLDTLIDSNTRLSTRPGSVVEFVEYLGFLQQVSDDIADLSQRVQEVQRHYSLMHTHGIAVQAEDKASFQMLAPELNRLKASILNAEAAKESNIVKFSRSLDGLIDDHKRAVLDVRTQAANPLISDVNANHEYVLSYIATLIGRIEQLQQQADNYTSYQELFRVQLRSYDDLVEAQQDIMLKKTLWQSYAQWLEKSEAWHAAALDTVDAELMAAQVHHFFKTAAIVERGLGDNPLVPKFKGMVDEYKMLLPLVLNLRNPALKERHWNRIEDLLGRQIFRKSAVTIGSLLDLDILTYREPIESVANEATQEARLEDQLGHIQELWSTVEFDVAPYKDHKDTYVLLAVDDVMQHLEDSRVTVSTIMGSRYVGAIRRDVEKMDAALAVLDNTLEEWLKCQRSWIYLEPIFTAPDIQRQLPNESRLFAQVDKSFRDIMKRTYEFPNALRASSTPGLLETFQSNNNKLDEVSKHLEEYLTTKRDAFPRFFFLSNDELLEILAQSKNPHAVQPHLRKCFDNLVRLDFGPETKGTDLTAFLSAEGERVAFTRTIKVRGNVEVWLANVEIQMVAALRKALKGALGEYDTTPFSSWVLAHPAQLVLAVAQVYFVRDVTRCLETAPGDLVRLRDIIADRLTILASLVRSDLTALQRGALVALITISVHMRDIVDGLAQQEVRLATDFAWQQQLRYHWDADTDQLDVRQASAVLPYTYEYLGATARLVITPLTDRCYMTLTGALGLYLGGAPAGPAGTGKTETVKDLAKALARFCVVFNCGEGLDYKFMGKFFSGLAQTGAWACFDEFNRIDIEVLSVIAQQLMTIQGALKSRAKRFTFEGRDMKIVPTFGCFVTMNPGYAGRTELPDNLKALFRPVAMMIPDYGLIAEIMLFSQGFEESRVLARKMVQLYKLCSEQLSQQDHYDFGMRALKAVLVMAGALKRASPDEPEEIVLIRAMRDSNLPKFLADDIVLFRAILSDLFPGVAVPAVEYGLLQEAISEALSGSGRQVVPNFVSKVLELYATLRVRFGVMLVGPSGGGKSTCLETIRRSLTSLAESGHEGPLFHESHTHVLNPKAVSLGELYGQINPNTLEWTDGLAAHLVRQCVHQAEESDANQWVVFDGPVDALWIENMNTVLDDNQTLCLANGERIKLPNTMRMLFEVEDLASASPATVSRCGMVYMSPDSLGWRPFVHSWLPQLHPDTPGEIKRRLIELFDFSVDPCIELARSLAVGSPFPFMPLNVVSSLCALFGALYHPSQGVNFGLDMELQITLCENLFAFCLAWAAGGNLDETAQMRIDTFIKDSMGSIPPEGTIYDHYVDLESCAFRDWDAAVPSFELDRSVPFHEMLVPTVDTVRFSYLVQQLVHSNQPVLLTGPTGVGKSVIVSSLLRKLAMAATADRLEDEAAADGAGEDRDDAAAAADGGAGAGGSGESDGEAANDGEHTTNAAGHGTEPAELTVVPLKIQFSARTSSQSTQSMIESKLTKRSKQTLGAMEGHKVVLFVDDVNMPAREVYGAQPPIELLRQFLDAGGFYDRKRLTWTHIEDVTMACACAPPGGGRNRVSNRFMRRFVMLGVPAPTEQTMRDMFEAILGGFLGKGFPEAVASLYKVLVACSVDVYMRISQELLPTPDKSHYTFNLRDLGKIFQGMMQAQPVSVQSREQMVRLWAHETMRVFHDRLVDDADRSYFTHMLADMWAKKINIPWKHDDVFVEGTLVFGDFGVARRYDEIGNLEEKLPPMLENYMAEYNMGSGQIPLATSASAGAGAGGAGAGGGSGAEGGDVDVAGAGAAAAASGAGGGLGTHRELKLVFFRDAMEHLARISRIIRQERGNALLVGVSGSGRRSLTRLACSMSEFACFEITLTKGYGLNDFREDLKVLYRATGVAGQNVVFLLSDTQFVHESMLEDVSNILNSGEVPDLFEADEREKVIAELRPLARDAGVRETRGAVWEFFVSRVRKHLHVVMCVSPVGGVFRERCRQFPSIIDCSTIDWFGEWPQQALHEVARQFLRATDTGADTQEQVIQLCVEMHTDVAQATARLYHELRRRYYVTPKSFLEAIDSFSAVLQEKRAELDGARARYATGLRKLSETNDLVVTMEKELNDLQPVLRQKAVDTEQLLERVARDQEVADEVRQIVLAEETIVKQSTVETQEIAEDAKRDLDEAMPAFNAAVEALNSLNKNDITEIKSFAKPPPLVQTVMEAVCILLQTKPDWETSKKVLTDTQFLQKLINFDKDNIPDPVLRRLRKYIDDPTFQPATVAKQSNAARSLCMWVRAMDVYSVVAREVAPKRRRLAEAETNLEESKATLAAKQAQLKETEDHLQSLRREYERSLAEKVSLQRKIEETSKRLQRAATLTTALADERVRWADMEAQLATQGGLLVGPALVASAYVAYCGVFPGDMRAEILGKWIGACRGKGIPMLDNFTVDNFLTTSAERRDWGIWGLPSDQVSVHNGIFVTRGRRWPLMIDPQGQASRWVKNLEANNQLSVATLGSPNFVRTLENCVRNGRPLLVEDVGSELDPILDPLLDRAIYRQAGRTLVRLADNDVDYDANFCLYLSTRSSNPHFMPEVCIKVTMVNFSVTTQGLEEQLLGDVVGREKPELEQQRDRLVVSISEDRKQLTELEDKVLQLMSESQGSVLDDELLIEALNETKTTAGYIQQRLVESEETEAQVEGAREAYRPAATRGAVLYEQIAQLTQMGPMYQFSLHFFKRLFGLCMESSPGADRVDLRLQYLQRETTEQVFRSVSRGLFEKDKLVFAVMVCAAVMREKGEIGPGEWAEFLRGGASGGAAGGSNDMENPDPSWLTREVWARIVALDQGAVKAFRGLADDVAENSGEWRQFLESSEPERERVPGLVGARLSAFQRLLLIKTMREDKTLAAATEMVRRELGKEFTEIAPSSLEEVYAESSSATPIILVLSTGADPTSAVFRFAEDRGMSDRLHTISLGQGQGPIAEQLVARGMERGDWVLLQNCHLAASWMDRMEQLVEACEPGKEFRLWLTSMPSEVFPVSVLQNGVKLTTEPAKGLKANLQRTVNAMSESDQELDDKRHEKAWHKMLFAVSFFHGVVQERRKFGPLGWNIAYEFNDSDYVVSREVIRALLETNRRVPWDALRYTIGQLNYGGRVTDDWDRRCLVTIMNKYFCPEMVEDDFALSASGIYRLPSGGFKEYVESLPYQEDPEVFGMHENANITFQLQESRRLVGSLRGLERGSGGDGGDEAGEHSLVEWCDGLLERVPDPLVVDDACEQVMRKDKNEQLASLSVVLLQEVARMNRLLSVIRGTTSDLKKGVKGLVLMSTALEDMALSIDRGEVPKAWAKAGYLSTMALGSWIADLEKRVEFLKTWLYEGEPASFWISGLFFPQGFLTGVLQAHARQHQLPIDTLRFEWRVGSSGEGVCVHGLLLEGARWNAAKGELDEALVGRVCCEMPEIWLIPTDKPKKDDDSVYVCPLYKTSVRAGVLSTTGQSTNFVVAVDLAAGSKGAEHWVMRGAALVTME